ncbi:MAG: MazG family protein [Jiangellaceae bacterium]
MATGRLVLLVTSPRVAPGLLSADAWDVLRSGRVLALRADHPQAAALLAAGISVELAAPDPVALVDAAETDSVAWLGSPDGDPGLADGLAAEVASRAGRGIAMPVIEVLTGSYDLPGARLLDLVAVMDRLRSPGGCPWDREQTHRTLATYLLEEAYETLEAIETDPAHLREELGDLLLQVVFHSRLAEEHETDPWSVDDVAAGIVDKLVRRHPHVFGDAYAPTAEHVEARWDELKREEKQRSSSMEGVPVALPALALAAKLIQRAEQAGVDVAVPEITAHDVRDDISAGDALLGLAAAIRRRGIDPEQALRDAARRFAVAVRRAEDASGG